MLSHTQAALRDSDVEGVHDMRVSIRRLRGAVSDFAKITDRFPMSKVNKRLKSVADALGEVRRSTLETCG